MTVCYNYNLIFNIAMSVDTPFIADLLRKGKLKISIMIIQNS